MQLLFAQVTFSLSLLGVVLILVRKMPTLAKLPESPSYSIYLSRKRIVPSFSFKTFWQKFLSRTRILVLKIEHRIDSRLRKIRQESKSNQDLSDDEYWDELKKTD